MIQIFFWGGREGWILVWDGWDESAGVGDLTTDSILIDYWKDR